MASLPNSRTVTYEEWLRMPEVSEGIEEVVNGEIRIMPPTKLKHGLIVRRLCKSFDAQTDDRKVLVLDMVVSPEARTVEVLFLEDRQLRRQAILAEGVLKPQHFPDVQINIAEIWPD